MHYGEILTKDDGQQEKNLAEVRERFYDLQNLLTAAPVDFPNRNLLRDTFSATAELIQEIATQRGRLGTFREKIAAILEIVESQLANDPPR